MNELAVPQPTPIETLPQEEEGGGDESNALTKCREVERAVGFEIAQHGHEVFVRQNDGRWTLRTGEMKRNLMIRFGSEPVRTGLWAALSLYAAVDPNNVGESCYFERVCVDGEWTRWKPMKVEPHHVVFRNGVYDLQKRTLRPFEETVIPFGPMVDVQLDSAVMEACRAGKYDGAPARVRSLLAMVDFALSDNGTPDPATVTYFRGVVAQVLRPHAGWTQFVTVIGESGARKTTILRALLSAPAGPQSLSEASEAVLAEDKFVKPVLAHKFANLSNDSACSPRFAHFIKEVTSGSVTLERKFMDPQKCRITAKLFSTTNEAQALTDNSLGVENRLIAFRFNPRDDNNRGASGTQWMDAHFYDEQDRLWLVSWMLTALEEQWKDGHEVTPQPTPRALAWKQEMLDEAMPMRAFVREHLEFKENVETPVNDIVARAAEAGYCQPERAHGFAIELGKFLQVRHKIKKRRSTKGEGRPNVYVGCVLKS